MLASSLPPSARTLGLAFIAFVVTSLALRIGLARDGDALYDGDARTTEALARGVLEQARADAAAFHTGAPLFDGEWAFGTRVMALLGLSQLIEAHPELRERYVDDGERIAAELGEPALYAFGAHRWGGEAALASLDEPRGHAYLGYAALALGAWRRAVPDTRSARTQERLAQALARRVALDPRGVVETYPGEAYPCDLAAVAGALALDAELRQSASEQALVDRLAEATQSAWRDPEGYLVQRIDTRTSAALDAPRGSGTALGAYFWSFADEHVAHELRLALLTRGARSALGPVTSIAGLTGVREVLGQSSFRGDIDSGPVLAGLSVSASGFALAAARQEGDRTTFVSLFRTASLVGVPRWSDGRDGPRLRYLAGGPLGNAILFAMMTARPA